jgi:hypothetical protein
MATMLEEYPTEEQLSDVRPLWAKGEKDIHKEMFPVSGGKWEFSQGRSKVADDARPGAEVAETTV